MGDTYSKTGTAVDTVRRSANNLTPKIGDTVDTVRRSVDETTPWIKVLVNLLLFICTLVSILLLRSLIIEMNESFGRQILMVIGCGCFLLFFIFFILVIISLCDAFSQKSHRR